MKHAEVWNGGWVEAYFRIFHNVTIMLIFIANERPQRGVTKSECQTWIKNLQYGYHLCFWGPCSTTLYLFWATSGLGVWVSLNPGPRWAHVWYTRGRLWRQREGSGLRWGETSCYCKCFHILFYHMTAGKWQGPELWLLSSYSLAWVHAHGLFSFQHRAKASEAELCSSQLLWPLAPYLQPHQLPAGSQNVPQSPA